MWAFAGDHWHFNEPFAPSRIVDPIEFPASRQLLEVDVEDIFSPDLEGLVFLGT